MPCAKGWLRVIEKPITKVKYRKFTMGWYLENLSCILATNGISAAYIMSQIAELDKKGAGQLVGKVIAERALEKGIKEVVFDRGGYIYTGRVAALAAGAREGGLDF